MSEFLDSEYCPQCSCSIRIPSKHWSGGEVPQSYRGCSCDPKSNLVLVDVNESKIVQDLALEVQKLQKWVGVLVRQIPQGSGPSVGAYISEDLHNSNLALPSHVLEGILKEFEEVHRGSHLKGELGAAVCLYCGNARFSRCSPDMANSVKLDNYSICVDCDTLKKEGPGTFRWVSKVIKFGYVRAPEQMMPVMPPAPPRKPVVLEAAKAITLDE